MQFRLTRRALDDLDLDVETYARRPASDFVEALENVEFGGRFPRAGGSRPNEIVICWRSF